VQDLGIKSTAVGETWIDENGMERSPLTREDILKFMKKNEMIKDNLEKFCNALKNNLPQGGLDLTP